MAGPAPFQRSYEELIDKMKGQDTLNGWDVLVTYDETRVNAALADRFASLNFDKPMQIKKTYISEH
jgi:hypothetical protein